MSIDIDSEINRFLDFWEKHGRDPDELRVSNWVLMTPGCEGDFGCCSKQFDLAGLTDALYELAGRKEPPYPPAGTIVNIPVPCPPVVMSIFLASNGDPGCVDIIVKKGDEVLERHKNKALSINHPSVPQSERDAAAEEQREWDDSEQERRDAEIDQDPHIETDAVETPTDGDAPTSA